MKIEISTNHDKISDLLDNVEKVVEDIDPDDAPEINCGFIILDMIGDVIDYFFGSYL